MVYKKWLFQTDLGFDMIYVPPYRNAQRATLRIQANYQLIANRRWIFQVGCAPLLTGFRYFAQDSGFQFYDDPLDKQYHTHWLPMAAVFAGADLRVKKKYHLVLNVGYQRPLYNKSGRPLDPFPYYLDVDFRVPFPRRLMREGSRIKNYY